MTALFPTTRAWGALLPYTPSGDGAERAATLSRSPGAVPAGIWVFDGAGAGVLVKNLASDEAGVGRSAPLHPLGRRGARGLRPSRALPGLFWWEIRFPSIQVILAIYLRPHGTHWGSGVVAFDQYGACTLTYLSTLDGSRGNTGEVSGLAEMAVRVGARVSLGASFLTEHRIYP